ncbi:MAG: lipase family protein [Saprospiraceae bacterium]
MIITKKSKVVHIFSSLANINMNIIAKTEEELKKNTKFINDIFTGKMRKTLLGNVFTESSLIPFSSVRNYIGDGWEVVWGVETINGYQEATKYTDEGYVTHNTMFVAKGKKDSQKGFDKTPYIVAVAGTNPVSLEDWLVQDLAVEVLFPWNESNDGHGKISAGSYVGLEQLISMKDSKTGDSLKEFFRKVDEEATEDYEIITCGHSLGGALSPLIALRLIEQSHSKAIVSSYPSAGPTSGNEAFEKYATEQFDGNYHSVINTNDIVPNAWNADTYSTIPELYNNEEFGNVEMSKEEEILYGVKGIIIKNRNYQRIGKSQEYTFTGQNDEDIEKYLPAKLLKNLSPFMLKALIQHVVVYNSQAYNYGLPLRGSLALITNGKIKK